MIILTCLKTLIMWIQRYNPLQAQKPKVILENESEISTNNSTDKSDNEPFSKVARGEVWDHRGVGIRGLDARGHAVRCAR